MLSANYDSRDEILKAYKPCFSSFLGHEHHIYFNPKDILFFADEGAFECFLQTVSVDERPQVRFLAFSPGDGLRLDGRGHFSNMTPENYWDEIITSSMFEFMTAVDRLGNLEEVTFLVPYFGYECTCIVARAIRGV